jgi:hypothetical protein
MKIKDFIRTQVLLPRLAETGVLVVYDPDGRYRDLCREMAGEKLQVVDAGAGSIESRELALAALQQLGRPNAPLDGLLVYVPARAPLTDEERQRDPFALYGACGQVFPDPANDGDEYLSLCLKARADQATEIRRIFQNDPNPSFAVIDAVGGGAGWPNLQAALRVESARDILFALLGPTEPQATALKGQDTWVFEARELLQTALGLKLITRAKSWEFIAGELWRFLLFSEFVFDLPEPLPPALTGVPHAGAEARLLVEDLCDRLRNDRRTQALYISRAEEVERSMNLPDLCREIADLGLRDTFPFEERSFFVRAIEALRRDNVDNLRGLLARHGNSIWVGRGENQAQWQILQTAAVLIQACEDAGRQLPEQTHTQEALIDFYLAALREVDRLQREFEQAAADDLVSSPPLDEVKAQARTTYQRLANRVQAAFVRHLQSAGWPPTGRLANADVFDRVVAPRLQESGRRVALLLIDALRYELGVELQKQLGEGAQVDLQPAFAQLPSVTPVGMASLLPNAGRQLRLAKKDDALVPVLGDQPLTTVAQRMDLLRERYGQRFAETPLNEFVRGKGDLPPAVDLLVIRSNEMDSDFENNPEAAPGRITRTFQRVVAAIHKLRGLGFQEAIVVTDHGFYLNTAAEAGDVCAKPPGKWLAVHDRMLLGDGAADSANVVLSAENLGIRGDFSQVALPRAMVAYRAGQAYFHGGASLQEALVPVLVVRLAAVVPEMGARPSVTLSYKRDSKKITTRRPVIVVEAGPGDLFSRDKSFEVLLEAHSQSGDVVGEAQPGGAVNAATRTVTLTPNAVLQVALKMDEAFQGKFTVKALDPTTLVPFDSIALETNYME